MKSMKSINQRKLFRQFMIILMQQPGGEIEVDTNEGVAFIIQLIATQKNN